MKVKIPFRPYFCRALTSGVKVCTARSSRMGNPGDTFTACGETFELLSLTDEDLYTVSTYWKEEGCNSREHFIEIWNEIHPCKHYSDSQRIYLHRFKLAAPKEPRL